MVLRRIPDLHSKATGQRPLLGLWCARRKIWPAATCSTCSGEIAVAAGETCGGAAVVFVDVEVQWGDDGTVSNASPRVIVLA